MRPHIVFTILRKELTEALRDRLTLAVIIGLPLLLYPLMILGMTKLQKSHVATEEERVSVVALWGDAPVAFLSALGATNHLSLTNWAGADDTVQAGLRSGRWLPPTDEEALAGTTTSSTKSQDSPLMESARATVLRREADAVLVVSPGFGEALSAEKSGRVFICFDSVRPASIKARERLVEALRDFRSEVVSQRERAHGFTAGFAEGFEILSHNLAPPKRQIGERLGMMLPLLIILLSASGGLYASIDLTAGEKDRATMQTLLCAPVRHLEIVLGKFLAVWCISLIAAFANVASIGATMARATAGASSELFSLSPGMFALALLLLLPATCTITALFLAIAMTARDAKDAGNFLGACFTLMLMPMMAVMLPGVDLNAWTAFVPLVNLSLLTKALFLNEAPGELVFMTVCAALLYAALALVFAARTFGREQVLLGGRTSLMSLLLPGDKRGGMPTPSLAIAVFAVVLVLGYYGSLLLTDSGMVTMVLATQLAFFLLPVGVIVVWMKFPAAEVLKLRPPPWRGVLAVVLIGVTAWAGVGGLVMRLLPPPDSLVKALEKVVMLNDPSTPLWKLWLVLALTPAVCEEFLFRGLIMSGLKSWGRWPAIVITALLFALAHASIYRLLPTFCLGLLLGYVVFKTGSIWCGVLLHALNNGTAVTLVRSKDFAERFGLSEVTHVPWSITLVALVVVAAGIVILRTQGSRDRAGNG
jgi:sodium transport system permease protein